MRLFFALQPDAKARHRLAELASDVAIAAGGRAPRAENLHVTMAFLGEVAGDRLDSVQAIGARSAHSATPFMLALDRMGMFRHSGIAWIAPGEKPDELIRLFDALRAALLDAALRVDTRDFHPHVTLARDCKRPIGSRVAPRISWRVETLALMASETRPEGAHYREVVSCPLAAA